VTLRGNLISYDLDNASQFTSAMLADITTFDGREGNIDLGLRLRWGQRAQSFFALTSGGYIRARGKGGGVTGRPAEIAILDDLLKDQEDADSEISKAKLWTWLQTVLFPRLAPDAPVVMPMTRWADDDPVGKFMQQQEELEAQGVTDFVPWTIVNIPAEAEENDPLGRKPGEWLLSARGRTDAQWRAIKATTDAKYFDSLYQGRPSVAGGDVFLEEWLREYNDPVWRYDPETNAYYSDEWRLWQTWDFAFRDKKSNDFVAGEVWATRGAQSRLVTLINQHLSFTDSVEAMKRMSRLFPTSEMKIVEGKANGDAIIDTLSKEIPGIVRADPKQSKVERARMVTTYFRAGNVEFPSPRLVSSNPELAFDLDAFKHQVLTFRENAPHDDMVDAMTQFLRERYSAGDASVEIFDGRVPTGPSVAVGNAKATPRSSIVAERIAAARGAR
jgi:predicted phage terminase large subunit-like protein